MTQLTCPAEQPHLSFWAALAAYTSFAVKRLEATASVISKVGGNFPEAYLWWLKQEGIDLSGVTRRADEQNTSFELSYNSDLSDRVLKLKSKGTPLGLADVPC